MYSNIILFFAILKRSRDCLLYPKKETVTWLSPIHKEGNGPVIVSYTQRRKWSCDCLLYTKKETVTWLSPIHKEGNEPCFIYVLIYDCTTFTSCVNVLNKNTVMTEGIQITLYSIISSISLVRHCLVLVKTKYMYSQCETETNITLMEISWWCV